MPKLEPKVIQKELEAGKLRPVYFIFGEERMKSRELQRRIEKAVLADGVRNDFNYERLDGGEVGIEAVLDAGQSFSLMGGAKCVVVKNSEDMKNLDPLVEYLQSLGTTEPTDASELSSVMIFISKSFDGRKKASKVISDLAAVIPCEAVVEQDRDPWLEYLAKRRGIVLSPEEKESLRGLDPWSLDMVDQELAKLELVADFKELRSEVLLSGVSLYARDEFMNAIFSRNQKKAMELVHRFDQDMETQLPFLGLLAWNLRHLKLFILEQETRSRSTEKRNPFLQRNLDRWKPHWNLKSVQAFEHALFEIDFSLKNTRLDSRALWLNTLIHL